MRLPPSLRKLARRLLSLALAFVAVFLIAATIFAIHCAAVRGNFSPTAATAHQHPADDRDEDSTFLGYPEWYIVWSYQEKADFQRTHLPAAFPYFSSIGQYWSGYCCVNSVVHNRYPFNFGEHLMLVVIGTSFSLEYTIKGLYEKSIGAFTEWTASHQATEEDRYASQVADDYAHFVHIRPFYEYKFWPRFTGLWRETPAWGGHPLRKWERRIWLSLDYVAEAAYCGAILGASHAVYGVEPDITNAVLTHTSAETLGRHPHVKIVKDLGQGSYYVALPRYQEFTSIAQQLAGDRIQFGQIAGNEQILLTVLQPRGSAIALPSGSELLFAAPLVAQPDRERLAIRCTVPELHHVLNALASSGTIVEHVYDY